MHATSTSLAAQCLPKNLLFARKRFINATMNAHVGSIFLRSRSGPCGRADSPRAVPDILVATDLIAVDLVAVDYISACRLPRLDLLTNAEQPSAPSTQRERTR